MASSYTRFLDHTQQRNTVGRIPLDEWSSLSGDLYLTTHNIHNRHPWPVVIRTNNPADLRLRPRGQWDLQLLSFSGFQIPSAIKYLSLLLFSIKKILFCNRSTELRTQSGMLPALIAICYKHRAYRHQTLSLLSHHTSIPFQRRNRAPIMFFMVSWF